METKCPQCNNVLNSPSARLVQDSCGHKKCRMCLVQDESDCKMCLQQDHKNRYKDNHTAVIICNKTNSTRLTSSEQIKDTVTKVESLQIEPSNCNTLLDCDKEETIKKIKTPQKKRLYKFTNLPHFISVVSENPVLYKCNICSKTFHTKSHFKYHNYCTEGRKPLSCKECKKEFITKYHLETHMLGHDQQKRYTCDICHKSFSRLGKLNRHKLVHMEIKKFTCQNCDKTFKNKDYLQRHSIIHTKEKPYSCMLCEAKFNNRSNLNKHQVTHSEEKVHMCDECGKRFKYKSALTVHRRSHTKLRPHNCTICSKTFINAKELFRHQTIHTDAKNYACSLCGISFRRKDNLQRHIRNTHPGKKATLIKKPLKRVCNKVVQSETPTENPNAIKVITSPSTYNANNTSNLTISKPVSVINAPLKLAFKTTAFKSNYNIHSREYVETPRIHPKPYDYAESVSICQKILSPCSPPQQRTIIKTLGNVSEKDSTEICQKILSPMPLVKSDTVFEKAYSIRNIKFKLPSKYINLSKKNIFNDISASSIEESNLNLENVLNEKTYTELKPVQPTNITSVIVNTQTTCQNEMHWRRRTLQHLEMQSKQHPD